MPAEPSEILQHLVCAKPSQICGMSRTAKNGSETLMAKSKIKNSQYHHSSKVPGNQKKNVPQQKVLKSAKIHQNPTISPWNHQNSTQQTHPLLRHGVLQAALFGLRHCVAQPRPSNHNKRNWKSPTYRNWSGEKKQVWNFLHAFWASLASSTSFSSWPLPLLTWIGTRIQSLRQTLAINTGASHVLVYDGRTKRPVSELCHILNCIKIFSLV